MGQTARTKSIKKTQTTITKNRQTFTETPRSSLKRDADEHEFTRIPIAGEDSDDYNTSEDDEVEEEEDEANLVMTLPLVEPLQAPATHDVTSPTFDDEFEFSDEIAFLIGHKDGIVRGHQLTPIPINNHKFEDLPTIDDKILFSNNLQAMQRNEHKRKISKQERRLDKEAQEFELLLFSDKTICLETFFIHFRIHWWEYI